VDPVTGGAFAFLGSFGDVAYEAFNLPVQIVRGIVNGTKKVAKKLDSSNAGHRREERLEREETLSQSSSIASTKTHGQGWQEEGSDSWEDIFTQSLEAAFTTSKGIGRLTKAGLASPLHFSLGIARGFQ
jgi:hypothetical protein